MEQKKSNAYVHVEIDKEILKKFKAIALERNTTVSILIRRFIASVIRQETKD